MRSLLRLMRSGEVHLCKELGTCSIDLTAGIETYSLFSMPVERGEEREML